MASQDHEEGKLLLGQQQGQLLPQEQQQGQLFFQGQQQGQLIPEGQEEGQLFFQGQQQGQLFIQGQQQGQLIPEGQLPFQDQQQAQILPDQQQYQATPYLEYGQDVGEYSQQQEFLVNSDNAQAANPGQQQDGMYSTVMPYQSFNQITNKATIENQNYPIAALLAHSERHQPQPRAAGSGDNKPHAAEPYLEMVDSLYGEMSDSDRLVAIAEVIPRANDFGQRHVISQPTREAMHATSPTLGQFFTKTRCCPIADVPFVIRSPEPVGVDYRLEDSELRDPVDETREWLMSPIVNFILKSQGIPFPADRVYFPNINPWGVDMSPLYDNAIYRMPGYILHMFEWRVNNHPIDDKEDEMYAVTMYRCIGYWTEAVVERVTEEV